jgi:pyrroloquinoline quinone biosynthesis protein B
MKILVLGSGSNHHVASRAGRGGQPADMPTFGPGQAPRASSSVAVSADGGRWALLNISGDIDAQLRRHPQLQPQRHGGARPIAAIVLTDTRLEHVGRLLALRASGPLELYATPGVFEDLTTGLPLLDDIDHLCSIHWHLMPVAGDVRAAEFQIDGLESLRFRALAMPQPAVQRLTRTRAPAVGDSIALQVEDLRDGRRLIYAPAPAAADAEALCWMRGADCLLLHADAYDSEVGDRAADAVHAAARRKVLLHMGGRNHPHAGHGLGPEALAARGIDVAFDGMQIEL